MGHLERGRNLKLLQAARESIFPIYLAFFCISDRSKKISRVIRVQYHIW